MAYETVLRHRLARKIRTHVFGRSVSLYIVLLCNTSLKRKKRKSYTVKFC